MQDYQTFIFTFLAIVVFILATYLGFLVNKLKIQKKVSKLHQLELDKLKQERELSIKESIAILSRAVINEQCEVSEGCIRIKKLLEIIEVDIDPSLIEPIESMYEQIKEFAILDERNALSKQEKYRQDKKRFAIEDRYQLQVKEACACLLEHL